MDAFDEAITQLKKLPGIGKKSAQRLVFHLLSVADSEVEHLLDSIQTANEELGYCDRCYGLAQKSTCNVCRDPERDRSRLAVIAQPEDVFPIEDTGEYNGLYHVLRGLISPLEGVGPEQLTIRPLIQRITDDEEPIEEIIFAFNPTNEGEVTINYLKKRLEDKDVSLSHLGYGIPVGSDIGYADKMTLSQAFENRVALDEISDSETGSGDI
ncbi:MAG: recombination mediator RecR [bacterium]